MLESPKGGQPERQATVIVVDRHTGATEEVLVTLTKGEAKLVEWQNLDGLHAAYLLKEYMTRPKQSRATPAGWPP